MNEQQKTHAFDATADFCTSFPDGTTVQDLARSLSAIIQVACNHDQAMALNVADATKVLIKAKAYHIGERGPQRLSAPISGNGQ